MTTSVIANIETGRRDASGRRRRDVTADEWLMLSHVLGVTPGELLADADRRSDIALTDKIAVPAIRLLGWLAETEPAPVAALLAGLAVCGSCGTLLRTRMENRSGADVRVYYCPNKKDPVPAVRDASLVDEFAESLATARLLQPDVPMGGEGWLTFPLRFRREIAALLFSIVRLMPANDWSDEAGKLLPDTVEFTWARDVDPEVT